LGLIAFPAIDEDEGDHQVQVGELIKQTAASIDGLALKMLFVTVQQNNLEVCIENAVNKSVVHQFIVASTYFSIRDIFLYNQTVVHVLLNCKDMRTQMNKETFGSYDCIMVWTLLLSGM